MWSVFDRSSSSISIFVSGNKVSDDFFLEPGIHRIQRIPPTETKGRRHTSTVAVAVLSISNSKCTISDNDLDIEYFCGSGPGGQHRNRTKTNVRITHKPTGITATASSKSQYSNRKKALSVIQARVQEHQESKSANSVNHKRNKQIGDMGRGTRVRTYSFTNGIVKDERVKKSFRIKDIISGSLGKIYKAYRKCRKNQ